MRQDGKSPRMRWQIPRVSTAWITQRSVKAAITDPEGVAYISSLVMAGDLVRQMIAQSTKNGLLGNDMMYLLEQRGGTMKRFEQIKYILDHEPDPQKIARYVCDYIAEKHGCDFCPCGDRCRAGHNGIEDYLLEEVEE